MKGVVFTEFLDFVSVTFGADMVDDIIDDAAPPNGGAYTAVGTYPFTEMGALVGALSQRTSTNAPDLLKAFGKALCSRFVVKYPAFFEPRHTLFDFLDSVDNHIHVEVHKLYPDAELPKFYLTRRGDDAIDLDYDSCRPLESLAEGMILAASEYFKEPVSIERSRMQSEKGAFVRFSIQRLARQQAA